MKIYRNIYFQDSIPSLTGIEPVYYSGKLVLNSGRSKSFLQEYDPKNDLYLPCGKCASKRYSKFIHKNT